MTSGLPNTAVTRGFIAAQQGDRGAFAHLIAATWRMVVSLAVAVVADLALPVVMSVG
ncbi:hypothetical protein [Tahibacter aquaticus]|uniref:hypothetical protein n=1 Tax=Tahibacter aquaticus TaxID=520092 RepID=UPI001414D623|nr:hypothetical protein [Tahibacter aquaticus]